MRIQLLPTTAALIIAAALLPAGPGLLIVSQTVQTVTPAVSSSSFHKLTVTEVVSAYVPLTISSSSGAKIGALTPPPD